MKILKKLSEALASLEQHHAAVAPLTALDEEKAARELVLLDTVDLHDSKSLAEISEVRLVRELIPRKLTAMEAPGAALTDALKAAVAEAFTFYNGQLHAKCEALRSVLRNYLAPVISDPARLDQHILDAWGGNALAAQLDGLSMSHEFSLGTHKENAAGVARKMLLSFDTLDGITIPEKL